MRTAREWMTPAAIEREQAILDAFALLEADDIDARLHRLGDDNEQIYTDCVNLNPAGNVMNPRAENLLSAGLSSHPSLGHPGDKYETGLEAVEEIEVIAAALAAEVFDARYSEIRVGSGALANLYAFMATCRPGDAIIAPPASIGGHVTHHDAGAAGLFGLDIHPAPVDAESFSVDVDALGELATRVKPALITIGGSLNLEPHPVAEVCEVAAGVGARVLFDAAHVCGLIAGRVWPNPLEQGADLMTMSTYKSLGGPAGGIVVTNSRELAERVDAIAFPGLTANFDVGTSASLAIALLDWRTHGLDYATAMIDTAVALAGDCAARGLPVVSTASGHTSSHQLAIEAQRWGDGDVVSRRLRRANLLTSGIGLPGSDGSAGIRLGTPEVVRWGMTAVDMPELAQLLADALEGDPSEVAERTVRFRHRFDRLHFIRS